MPIVDLSPSPNTGNDTVTIPVAGLFSANLGDGNDSFWNNESPANFTVLAGTGNDTIAHFFPGEHSVDLGTGNDRVDSTSGNWTIVGGAGNDTLDISDGIASINAGSGADSLSFGEGSFTAA